MGVQKGGKGKLVKYQYYAETVGKETRGSKHEVSDATSSYKYGPEECACPIPRLIPSLLSLSLSSLSLSLSHFLFLSPASSGMVISLRLGRSKASACIRTIGGLSPRSANPNDRFATLSMFVDFSLFYTDTVFV